MDDLPQSAVEAMARARYERSRGIGTYTWEERNKMLPAHNDLEEAAADLQAALDEGGVVTKAQLERAVMNVMQLDTLRRSEEERTKLKQELRQLRMAANHAIRWIAPGSTLDSHHREDFECLRQALNNQEAK